MEGERTPIASFNTSKTKEFVKYHRTKNSGLSNLQALYDTLKQSDDSKPLAITV